MTQDIKKKNSAKAAFELIKPNLNKDIVLGIGTGSTTNFFIEELNESDIDIKGAVCSSISSEEKVLFEVKGLEIISRSMEIIQVPQKELKILFKNANFSKINSRSSIKKGKANKIELFPSKDLIFMEGNAEFYEDNMKIISDKIHYDLREERILKSINAKIFNNLWNYLLKILARAILQK